MRISETLLIGNSLACQKENSKFFNPTGNSPPPNRYLKLSRNLAARD